MLLHFIYCLFYQKISLIIPILYLAIFISNSSESFLSFKYPQAITIKEEKILVIHQDGVTICDPTLEKEIKKEIIFEEEEKINTEAALSKVTILYEKQFDDKYIISLINDYIYIFNDDGNFTYKSENNIHYNNTNVYGEYYTLVGVGSSGHYYYYVIGFIYNQKIYLYAYKYNFVNNINTKYDQILGFNHRINSYSSYYIMNKALSCEYVEHYNLGYVLLCVFLINNPQVNNHIISFEYIKVYTTYMEFASTQYIKIFNFYYNISCFKTILNSDRNKLLIVGYCTAGLGIFSIYNVNTNELHNSHIINHYFRKIYYNLQIKYFDDTDEYILSGLLTLNDRDDDNNYENDNIVFEFYHNNFNNYKYGWKYDRKCQIYGYSILYLKQKNSYYILSDINCNGTKYPFQPLLNENLQEDDITEELQIQNTVNYVTQNTDIFVNQSSENSQYTDPQFQNNSEIKENIFNSFIMNLTENIFDSSVENNILLNKTKKIEKFIHDLITEFNVTNNNKNNIIQETGEDNILITLTTTYNSKYHENKAKINVDLDQCESILKSAYNISINDTLYIILIEIKEEGMKIPKVEYEIYYPLYHRNLSKLY